jgi:predicted RNase H-like nuclease
MTWIAGIDGCRAGWIAVLRHIPSHAWHFRFARTLIEIIDGAEQPGIVAIDMPTGFADGAERGGRACERAARKLLRGKTSSVFPTPCRAALAADTHAEACDIHRRSSPGGIGLTVQAFHLFPKMRELDALMLAEPALRPRLFEAHPELAFARMNGGKPVLARKRGPPGQAERSDLLARHGFAAIVGKWNTYQAQTRLRRAEIGLDDVLDAAAVCRTAQLICQQRATCLPDTAERDSKGLPMAIWY